MNKLLFISLFSTLILTTSCQESEDFSHGKKIEINQEIQPICLDGFIKEQAWDNHLKVQKMVAHEKTEQPDNTQFYACINEDKFYFAFDVRDTTLVTSSFVNEFKIAENDRVGLFFSPLTPTIENYYCI